MWGISRGFVLIQDGGDCSCKDFWVQFGTLKQTVICGIRFIVFQSMHRLDDETLPSQRKIKFFFCLTSFFGMILYCF